MNRVGYFRVFLVLGFAFLFAFPLVSSLSNEGDYFNYLGNISTRLLNGTANVLIVGDSINSQTSGPSIIYGIVDTWKPYNWRGIVTQTHSGLSIQGSVVGNEPTSKAEQTNVKPGQNFSWSGTDLRGYNLKEATYYNFTADANNLQTAITMKVSSLENWSINWTDKANLSIRFMYLSNLNATAIKVRGVLRDGTTTSAGISSTLAMNNSNLGIYYGDFNYFTGSGATTPGMIGTFVNGVNESLSHSQFYLLGTRLWLENVSTGIQIDYTGEGGYTTKSHAESGELLDIEGENIFTYYSNYTLQTWMNYTGANTFIIWLGQNSAGNEWDGSTIRNYSQNILNIIKRYSDNYYSVNATTAKPYFLLVSPYDTNVNNVRHSQIEAALLNISANYSSTSLSGQVEIGFINLRKYVNDTNGTYSNWNNTYTRDGIHPAAAGADFFAQALWNQIILANQTPNGTLNGINWKADSHRIINYSLSSNGIGINNTGYLTGSVEITSGLTDSLLHNDTSLCAGYGDVNSNDIDLNLTLSPGDYCYVLNNFNLTEGVGRNQSPLWFSSSTSTLKHIASNLTDTINSTVSFDVDSCSTISSIVYTSNTGTYTKDYASNEYDCSGGIVTLNVSGIETATGSNSIAITYNTPAIVLSSDQESIGGGFFSSGFVSDEELHKGYRKTFYKDWVSNFKVNDEKHSLKVLQILGNSVVVQVSSNPIVKELLLDSSAEFDLDNDGYYDVSVRLEEINQVVNSAVLILKSVEENASQEEKTESPEIVQKPIPKAKISLLLISFLGLVFLLILVILLKYGNFSQKKRY